MDGDKEVHLKEEEIELYNKDDGTLITSAVIGDLSTDLVGNAVPLKLTLSYHKNMTNAFTLDETLHVMQGWISLIPAITLLIVALTTKEVLWALYSAVFVGAWIVAQGNPVTAFERSIDHYAVGALNDSGHIAIILFSWFLAGMVAVIQKSGGGYGLAASLSRTCVKSRRGMLIAVFVLGLLIFFDDYANVLIVGNTMRPLADSYFVSREKLAFMADCTSAPIASIAPVSSWIGFELGLIDDTLKELKTIDGMKEKLEADGLVSPYSIFMWSVVGRFYPICMLFWVLFTITLGREFGPMLRAERRAIRQHKLVADNAQTSQVETDPKMEPGEGVPLLWWNAVVPVVTTVAIVVGGLIGTGVTSIQNSPLEAGQESRDYSLAAIFGGGDSFSALMWGGWLGSITIWIMTRVQYYSDGKLVLPPFFCWKNPNYEGTPPKPILTFKESLECWIEGLKSMACAVLILILAWSVGTVVQDVGANRFIGNALTSNLAPEWLPVLTFLVSAIISFCTGTSWGTMTIMFPLVAPVSYESGGKDVFVLVVSAILAGSVFGDHATAISDTTILSSLATRCDLTHHVTTQMPYALMVALISSLFGYLLSAWVYPVWVGLLICIAVTLVVGYLLSVPVAGDKEDPLTRCYRAVFRKNRSPENEMQEEFEELPDKLEGSEVREVSVDPNMMMEPYQEWDGPAATPAYTPAYPTYPEGPTVSSYAAYVPTATQFPPPASTTTV